MTELKSCTITGSVVKMLSLGSGGLMSRWKGRNKEMSYELKTVRYIEQIYKRMKERTDLTFGTLPFLTSDKTNTK